SSGVSRSSSNRAFGVMMSEAWCDMARLPSVSANWPKEPPSHPGITAVAVINPNCVLPDFSG
ncbi:hypothetical protein, partial [Stenotrophomonas maltophilia group sp. Smal35]|uniref:hypothetical protein n=1 Tax=Stenotrophomonas maltophilia group sp. Smal35 TaxID=3377163 RepID=UPI002552B569